ncbi:RRF domain-containing protein [Haematococcus lacustris]|uniref:Ribosome-recycling factor, chloroplastic n=1 Tax=Haematococcus lacustris TaxID=44745 RepID=A0A699Z758_HAELA|nr:RRF domain-containing protein [Haematococcus lacustris]
MRGRDPRPGMVAQCAAPVYCSPPLHCARSSVTRPHGDGGCMPHTMRRKARSSVPVAKEPGAGKQKGKKEDSEEADVEPPDLKLLARTMDAALADFQKELSKFTSGRVSPQMLEVLPVAVAEHKHVPLKSCATVAVRSINKLAVSPYQPALSVLEPMLFFWSWSCNGPVEEHCQPGRLDTLQAVQQREKLCTL